MLVCIRMCVRQRVRVCVMWDQVQLLIHTFLSPRTCLGNRKQLSSNAWNGTKWNSFIKRVHKKAFLSHAARQPDIGRRAIHGKRPVRALVSKQFPLSYHEQSAFSFIRPESTVARRNGYINRSISHSAFHWSSGLAPLRLDYYLVCASFLS